MKKPLLLFALSLAASLTMAACQPQPTSPESAPSATSSSAEKDEIREIYAMYKAAGGNLSYEEWLRTIKGEPGEDGTSFRYGQGAPAQNLGKDGDSYLDLSSWDVYVKTNGSWLKQGNVKGQQGPKGDPGEQGPKGDKGDTGQDGKDGKDGSDGKSAYEIYVAAHPEYTGTEEEWLDDLVNGRLGDRETHTVTFDSKGGSPVPSQQVLHGEKAAKPTDPTRDGYRFLDWVDENDDHWVFNGFSVTADITLCALWSDPIDYSVTFANDDGSTLYETTAHYGDVATYPLENPTPSDPEEHYIYSFSGWDKELVVTGDVVFQAQYARSYVATTAYYYDSDGQTLLATVPLAEGEAPHYNGATPTKERDKANKLQFEFEKWEKAEETASTVKFVAKYASCTDGLDIEGNKVTNYHGTSPDVVIPSVWGGAKITSISEGAFDGNATVKSIFLPDTLVSIGYNSFQGCSSLTSIEIPSSVTSIGNNAFSDCSSLSSITIPNGVTSINYGAFRNCSSLSSITIPNGVTSINYAAFYRCPSLSSIVFPDSLTTIARDAFRGCSSLTSIRIPSSVTSIGSGAFVDADSLRAIYCDAEYKPAGWEGGWKPNSIPVVWGYEKEVQVDDLWFAIGETDDERTAALIGYEGSPKDVVIPETVDGATVIVLGDRLFAGCSFLTSIVIPSGVTSIGDFAFSNCTSLVSIKIPSSVTSIGDDAFYGCSSLASVEIPSSVTSIGNYAFYRCSSLDSVEIPESVTSIGDDAFNGCSSLASVEIPSSVTSIGNYAFYGCSSLDSVEIPESVTSIGNYAFYGCSSLASIVIPKAVTKINYGTFWCGSALRYAFYGGTAEEWAKVDRSENIGNEFNNATTVYFYSEQAPSEAGNYWHYVDGVPTVW